MKKHIFSIALAGISFLSITQSLQAQNPWTTELNDVRPPEIPQLGTINPVPLTFVTNGNPQMTLSPDGSLQILGLADPGISYDRQLIISPDGTMRAGVGISNPYVILPLCKPNAVAWAQGGNNAAPGSPTQDNVIGTCNDADFILKANNQNMLFMKTTTATNSYGSTLLGIGPNNSNPQSQLDVTDGIIDVGAGRTVPDHLRIYGNYDGTMEATGKMNLYYQDFFSVNTGTLVGGSTAQLSIDPNGLVGIGQYPMFARLSVNANGYDGINIGQGSNSAKAICTYNSAGAYRFCVYGDGKTHIADNTQIGFVTSPSMVDPNFRLNLSVPGSTAKGLKITTNYSGRMIEVNNSLYSKPTFSVDGDGTTHIGANFPDGTGPAASALLSVYGMILAKEIRVAISQGSGQHWADFVFAKDYKPMSLTEVEKYVQKNKHLPDVPSEADVKKDGVDLVQMNVKLLQKVEELYLHTIELKKQVDEQKAEIERLKK